MLTLDRLRKMNAAFKGQPAHIVFLWNLFCAMAVLQAALIVLRTVLLIHRAVSN